MGRLNFKEVALVHHFADQFMHVVGLVGIGRDQRVEAVFDPVPRVRAGSFRHRIAVRRRQEIDEVSDRQQRFDIIFERHVRHA